MEIETKNLQRLGTYLITCVHKGIKPFQCKECLKTFTQKGNLKKHLLIRHSEVPLKDRKAKQLHKSQQYWTVIFHKTKIHSYNIKIHSYNIKIHSYNIKIHNYKLKYIAIKLIYVQTSTLISIKLIYAINHTTDVLILNNIYYKTKCINFMQYFGIESWVLIIKY